MAFIANFLLVPSPAIRPQPCFTTSDCLTVSFDQIFAQWHTSNSPPPHQLSYQVLIYASLCILGQIRSVISYYTSQKFDLTSCLEVGHGKGKKWENYWKWILWCSVKQYKIHTQAMALHSHFCWPHNIISSQNCKFYFCRSLSHFGSR